jgi:hypothetical protein
MIDIITIGLLAFLLGFFCGGFMINHKWISNSNYPQSILHKNKFYKTIEIGSKESWYFAELLKKIIHGE